jgi:SNF2 family DNA or RNA helicase
VRGFLDGSIRVLVTKASMFGFGLNLQCCNHELFVGLSDSYEQFYQAVRRCWRFGQKKPVNAHLIISNLEGAVLANLKRKEADAARMAEQMVKHMADISSEEIRGVKRDVTQYKPKQQMKVPAWLASKTNEMHQSTVR